MGGRSSLTRIINVKRYSPGVYQDMDKLYDDYKRIVNSNINIRYLEYKNKKMEFD